MLATMAKRTKKCKACGEQYTPYSTTHQACSPKCALVVVERAKAKKRRRENRQAKERLKTRGAWLREAQREFNRFIRLRDKADPCISCGRHHQGQFHAGHYRTVGACPELRFEELNCHKQCAPCNNHKSGNIVEYRLNLVQKIGADALAWLEGPHDPTKYTVDEIKAIKAAYRAKCKELEQAS